MSVKSFVTGFSLLLLQSSFNQGIPLRSFYPFSRVPDTRLPANDDSSSGEVTLAVPFPFFKSKYQSLYVNTNGVISFKDSVEEFVPVRFPTANNRPMIAPFWADVDTRDGGEIFYRQSTNVDLSRRATNDVRRYFGTQFSSFQASWVFIATWQNVPRFRTRRRRNRANPLKNTFQVVLITNGRHSFAIFYYNKIEWTAGAVSKNRLGEIVPAQAGFNFGDGQRYHSVQGSQTDLIRQLPTLSNVGVPGMFVFRVDEAEIRNAGCNTAGGLTLVPRSGLVLGGTLVEISGPCFNNTSDAIVCRFNGNILADGNVVDRYKASCVTPHLRVTGRMSLEMSLDDGKTFNFSSQFTSVPLGRHGPGISGLISKDWISHINPLSLAWNPHDLRTQDLVNVEVARFDWETLMLLENKTIVKKNIPNFGFDIVRNLVPNALYLPPLANKSESEKYVSPLAIVTISAPKPARGLAPRIYSEPFLIIPVNYNISKEMKDAFDNLGIPQRCKDWFGDDDFDGRSILDELIGCPNSLEQAEADSGRFMSDDYCKPPRTSSCLTYQNGSYHCFRTIFPSRSGAGQQCCYTKQGRLVVGPPGGGTVDRYHADSSRFATLRHLKEDVYPWYLCCRLSEACGLYYSKRPSENGTRYIPPQIATTFGDPHLVTLDGFSYTFNGHGEYTMLNIDEIGFKFQARMQPLKTQGGDSRGTFSTAFVVRDEDSDTVQVELNSLNVAEIFVNGVEESFEPKQEVIELHNLMLQKRTNDSVVQIIFRSGISIEVQQNDISLSFVTLLPESFKGQTKGLLGVWDDDTRNDFTLPNGEQIDINSKSSIIHTQFGQKWLLNASESLFTYHEGKQHKDFVDIEYTPIFLDDLNSLFRDKTLEAEAKEICGDVKECLFDIAASGRLRFGNTTRQSVEDYNKKKKDITTVREPLFYDCDGVLVSKPCKACQHMCVSSKDYTVLIVLTVLFGILACIIAALVCYYIHRIHKQKAEPRKLELTIPKEENGNKPTSTPTVMAFVLPEFAEDKSGL